MHIHINVYHRCDRQMWPVVLMRILSHSSVIWLHPPQLNFGSQDSQILPNHVKHCDNVKHCDTGFGAFQIPLVVWGACQVAKTMHKASSGSMSCLWARKKVYTWEAKELRPLRPATRVAQVSQVQSPAGPCWSVSHVPKHLWFTVVLLAQILH